MTCFSLGSHNLQRERVNGCQWRQELARRQAANSLEKQPAHNGGAHNVQMRAVADWGDAHQVNMPQGPLAPRWTSTYTRHPRPSRSHRWGVPFTFNPAGYVPLDDATQNMDSN